MLLGVSGGSYVDLRALFSSNAVLGRSVMLDAIRLTESIASTGNLVYVVAGSSNTLPLITAALQDQDGSEQLQLELLNIPSQIVISDGTRQFVASSSNSRLIQQ